MKSFTKQYCSWTGWLVLLFCTSCYGGSTSFRNARSRYAEELNKKLAEQWQSQGIQSALRDSLPAVRLLAIQEMQSFSRVDGIDPSLLITFLTSQNLDTDATVAVVSALGRVQARDQIPQLLDLLKNSNSKVRAAAASSLGLLQAREQTPRLHELLSDESNDVRCAAVWALGHMKAKNEAQAFGRLLTDPDPDVAVAAADALGEMEAQQAIPELESLLGTTKTQPSDIDSAVPVGYGDRERSMANALARILQAGGNTPGLEALLKNPNGFVRMAAIDALGNLQGMEVSPEITTRFNKAIGEERGSPIRALGRMQARNQIPEFVKLLRDNNYSEAAADALGELDANETVPEIVKLLEDKDFSVRWAAAYALGRLQAKETAPEVAKLLKDQEPPVRSEAAKALGRMRAKEMAPEIVKLLNDPDGYVHEGAFYSLELMGPLPNTIVSALASLFYSNQARQDESRFLCYYLTGGDPAVSLLLRRSLLQENQEPVILATSAESREEIRAIHDLIGVTRSP